MFSPIIQNSNNQMELDSQAKAKGVVPFGSVYQCQGKGDSQVYAVKVICKNNVKRSKNFIYLKMELVKNGTLERLIKKRWEDGKKFNDEEISTVMAALQGLNIHSASIIHRDIKPDNILLPNEEKMTELKIADFGLSTNLDFHYPKTATSKCGIILNTATILTPNPWMYGHAIIMHMLGHGKHPLYEPKMSTEDYKRKIKNIKFASFSNKYDPPYIDLHKISLRGFLKWNPTKDFLLKRHQGILGSLAASKTKYLLVSMSHSLGFKITLDFSVMIDDQNLPCMETNHVQQSLMQNSLVLPYKEIVFREGELFGIDQIQEQTISKTQIP